MKYRSDGYGAFLRSSFWKRVSKQKKQLVGRCERCSCVSDLQTHHKFYRDNWWDTELGDLEVLCRGCHRKQHGIMDERGWVDRYQSGDVDLYIAFERIGHLCDKVTRSPFSKLDKKFLRRTMAHWRDHGGVQFRATHALRLDIMFMKEGWR